MTQKSMHQFLLALLLGIAILPAVRSNTQPKVAVITLERTACYGTCPVYKLTIFDNGEVRYEGKEFVKTRGKARGWISKERLAQLIAEFTNINYFSLRSEYVSEGKDCPEWWTDSPSAVTSLNWEGRKKSIRHYHGCRGSSVLDSLTELENKVDRWVNSDQWVK